RSRLTGPPAAGTAVGRAHGTGNRPGLTRRPARGRTPQTRDRLALAGRTASRPASRRASGAVDDRGLTGRPDGAAVGRAHRAGDGSGLDRRGTRPAASGRVCGARGRRSLTSGPSAGAAVGRAHGSGDRRSLARRPARDRRPGRPGLGRRRVGTTTSGRTRPAGGRRSFTGRATGPPGGRRTNGTGNRPVLARSPARTAGGG